ncbi:unnamed protein product, partial [Cladocopium goreaui]
ETLPPPVAPWSVVQLAGPFSNQPATMARPLLALTALGAGLGFVAPSVGRGLCAAALALGTSTLRGTRSRVVRAGKDEEAGEGEWRDAKNITANEPQFTGHFPDNPIMPGVLQVEALAQLAGVVCMQPGDQVLFAGIDGVPWRPEELGNWMELGPFWVKFRKPVVPGDTLVMEVEVKKFREKVGIAKITGAAFVDGQKVLQVKEFTCALVKVPSSGE